MTLHDYLFTLLLSMAPVSELRGAIPFGLAHDIPQALLYPSCILANLLPVPFVIVFLRRILSWMQRRGGKLASAACWLEHRGRAKSARIKRSELLGLYLFVAIPLTGTGAWTGTLAASILDMKFKDVLIACMGGVLLAGIIMGLASAGLLGALSGLFAV